MAPTATDQIRSDWEKLAPGWFSQRESLLADSRPIHEWLVNHLDPKPGERILELAAGPGDTGFLVARRLGNGRLVSTDLAPAMVEIARKRGAELGITNADYRVLDAQAMDLDNASFAGVICRWAFMLMPDPTAGFRECHRVLKPGGRLAFAVFTGPEDNAFASLPGRVLREQGLLPPAPEASAWQPGILALADRTRLDAHIAGAGFTSVHIEPVDMAWRFANTGEYWTFLVEVTALGPVVRALTGATRDAVRREIDARLTPFTRDGRIALPARCWCGLAIR